MARQFRQDHVDLRCRGVVSIDQQRDTLLAIVHVMNPLEVG